MSGGLQSLLDRPPGESGARIFTIPPSARFLDALARQLWAVAGGDALALADIQVFLPTRRAARALITALRETAPGGDPQGAALIAPAIRPLGDLDADEPPFEPGGPALDALPEIGAARRLFALSQLARAKAAAQGREPDPAGSLAAAREIAAALDEIATAEISNLSALDAALRARLPAHFQDTAALFDILLRQWPVYLAEQDAMDPAARRALLLRALAEQWRETPPKGPVIAAGSTGVAPAVADLLGVIARLPGGAVILPGLDLDLDDESWAALDPQHPQYQLRRLLGRLGAARADISVLPGAEEGGALRPRRRLIAQALLPAEASGGMLASIAAIAAAHDRAPADFARDALEGLSLIEARTEEEEALALALAMRAALEGDSDTEHGGEAQTVMLVTPDTALAARVSARLSCWGIAAQSSAGRPLAETAPAAFLTLLLELAADPADSLRLCALWKHPLCALGRARPDLRATAAALERRFLRGPRPADLRAAMERDEYLEAPQRARFLALVDDTRAALAPLTALAGAAGAPERARALAEAAEAFARTPDRPGAARVWAGEGGEGAARLIAELMEEGGLLPPADAPGFARLFAAAMTGRVVRPRGGEHPRLRILGPLEARLQSADLVILAGLNEGAWPAPRAGEPLLSREMRAAIGLDQPERRIGQAAHDFAQAAGARRAILSRALRRDGAPAVASRFLWRLKTLAAGALGVDPDAAIPAHPALGWARALDHVPAGRARPLRDGPAPRPPLAARPRSASATELRIWVRDPYAVYAKRILKLRALDKVDMAPGARERGTALHAALEAGFDALAAMAPEAALDALTAQGEAMLLECGLAPEQLAFAVPRFRRAARWLCAFEARRREEGWAPVDQEAFAEWEFSAPGGPFKVRAKADRLDRNADGRGAILDYKTGGAPSAKEVRAGFDLQMPVQAAMAAMGLFGALPPAAPSSLLYLRLGGGRVEGAALELTGGREDWSGEDYAGLGARVVRDLARFFDDPANPYRSQPRAQYVNDYGDYDHLARRGEWAAAGGDDGGGE